MSRLVPDPVTLEVVRHALYAIAEEMSVIVMRSARSPLLKEAGDREGMENEYREVIHLADGTALGELARRELRAALVTEGHQP